MAPMSQQPASSHGAPQAPKPRSADAAPQGALDALRGVAFAEGDSNVATLDDVAPGPHRASVIGLVGQLLWTLFVLAFVLASLVVGGIMSGVGDEEAKELLLGVAIVAAAVIPSVVAIIVDWRVRTWELADDAFVLRSGFFVRNARRIPYQRVHSVDLSSSILQRVLGLTTLTVDTGASETGEGNRIKNIKRSDAEVLKRALFARKALLAKGEAADAAFDMPPLGEGPGQAPTVDLANDVDYEMELGHKFHLLGSLTDFNLGAAFVALIVFFGGALQLVEPLLGAYLEERLEHFVLGALGGAAAVHPSDLAALMPHALGVVVVLLAGVLLVTWIISAVMAYIRWGGFVLRRRGDRIEVSSGLLSRTTRAVDIGRVQSVAVEQSPLRRLAGYAQVSVNVVASGGEKSGDRSAVVLHPCLAHGDVAPFLADVLPSFAVVAAAGAGEGLDHLPGAALRRTLLRGFYWSVLAVVVLAGASVTMVSLASDSPWGPALLGPLLAFAWACLVVGLIAMFIVRVLAWRIRRIGTRGSMLVLVDGGVARRVSYTERPKVQSLSRRVTPFQAYAKVATISCRTACVSAERDPHMRDVGADTAERLMAWVRPRYDNAAEAEEALRVAGVI